MYEDDEEDPGASEAPLRGSPAPVPELPAGGALSALSAPEGLFPKATDLIPMPEDPVNKNTKWRAFAGNVLKGHTLAEGLGAATSAYADQENKDAEMRMRYIPLANQARLQRAAQQLNAQKQQQALLETWNKTLIGNAASLLGKPGPVDPGEVTASVAGAVQRGQVPPQLAEAFVKGLPQDPVALRAYLERAAISMVDPFRAVAKPEFKSVAPGATLVQTNAPEGVKPVVAGGAKPSELATAIAEASALPPGDPRRKDYEALINRITTHNPNQVNIINPAKPLINELMGGFGTALTQARGVAEASVGTMNSVSRLRAALDSGNITAGPGATARIFLAQLGQTMGIPGKTRDEMLTNTRAAIQAMAQSELEAASGMKGQGALSDNERKLLSDASLGKIDNATIPELRTLADVLERVAKYKIGRFRSNLNRMRMIPGSPEAKAQANAIADMLDLDVPEIGSQPALRYDSTGRPLPAKE